MACGMAKRDMPWTITGLGSSNDPATGTGHMCLYENKAHPKSQWLSRYHNFPHQSGHPWVSPNFIQTHTVLYLAAGDTWDGGKVAC